MEDFSGIKGLFGPLLGKDVWDQSVARRGNNQSKGPGVGMCLLVFLQKNKEASVAEAGARGGWTPGKKSVRERKDADCKGPQGPLSGLGPAFYSECNENY